MVVKRVLGSGCGVRMKVLFLLINRGKYLSLLLISEIYAVDLGTPVQLCKISRHRRF